MGFQALAGLPFKDWPPEIRLYHRTVSIWLANRERNKTRSELEVLRFVSCGVYWMRGEALQVLSKVRIQPKTDDAEKQYPFLKNMFATDRSSTRERALIDLINAHIIQEERGQFPAQTPAAGLDGDAERSARISGSKYFAPLGFRAIVQDRWKAQSPEQRAITHLAIANLLFEYDRRRNDVRKELPFGRPAVGRGRLFYILEVIRHFVRASEYGELPVVPYEANAGKTRADKDHVIKHPREYFEHFWPGSPKEFLLTTAFELGFLDLMNQRGGDALIRRYGLYRVIAEAVSLMDQAGYAPENPSDLADVLRLQATALFELGALDLAQLKVREAMDRTDIKKSDMFVFSMLNIEIELERANVTGAKSTIMEARTQYLGELPDLAATPLVEFRKSRERQLAAREAALALLEDNPEGGLKILDESMETQDPSVATVEMPDELRALAQIQRVHGLFGHRYIDGLVAPIRDKGPEELAKLDPDTQQKLRWARIICGDNAALGQDGANLHSRLGYRIQYASLQRLLGRVDECEVELCRIRDYIYMHGASIRTAFAFQLEAAHCLMSPIKAASGAKVRDAKPLRALGIYLLPLTREANRLGFHAWVKRSLPLAERALEFALEARSKYSTEQGWKDHLDGSLLNETPIGLAHSSFARSTDNVVTQSPFKRNTVRAAYRELESWDALETIQADFASYRKPFLAE